MGGFGSGGQGAYPTAEATDSRVLSMDQLRKQGLRVGIRSRALWTWGDGFEVSIEIETRDGGAPTVTLSHRERRGDEREIAYAVHLATTAPPFGGLRWWFLCPETGRRVHKLYLPLGGTRFLSRQAYRLGYATQRNDKLSNAHRRAWRVRTKLDDGEAGRYTVPDKPKWMRWATYWRLVDELEAAEARIDAAWLPGVARLLARIKHR